MGDSGHSKASIRTWSVTGQAYGKRGNLMKTEKGIIKNDESVPISQFCQRPGS